MLLTCSSHLYGILCSQTLVRLLALTIGYPLLGAQAQNVWETLSLPQSDQLRWQPLPDAARTAGV